MKHALAVTFGAITLTAIAFSGTAFAAANVSVNANSPAGIALDGQPIGQSPTVVGVPPGFHQLRVESLVTHEVRVYEVYSPATAAIQKDLAIEFQNVPTAAVAADAPGVDPNVAAAAAADRERQNERNKVRTRNALLGAAVANEIFNRGNSKKVVRDVSLGGALLNELIKR